MLLEIDVTKPINDVHFSSSSKCSTHDTRERPCLRIDQSSDIEGFFDEAVREKFG